MKKLIFIQWSVFMMMIMSSNSCFSAGKDTILPRHVVALKEAHIGDLEIDTHLLDSYELLPENIRNFYFHVRSVFADSMEAYFTNTKILEAAQEHKMPLMGGPMLGDLKDNRVSIWIRPSTNADIDVKIRKRFGLFRKTHVLHPSIPGQAEGFTIDKLASDKRYKYAVYSNNQKIADGQFRTAPSPDESGKFRLAFGSCFHKRGLHNPNLINQVLNREPQAMMLLGDIAVDDRENLINMHRADYLLRDVSKPWRQLSANVPLYTAWDDHDYFNNDLGGIPQGFSEEDRTAVREVWHQNWNNPKNDNPGIYFNSRVGPVEIIMLDTRSCRENERRGEYGSYLGLEQLQWIKEVLKSSEAPFKVISSGTMWSDYISNGKDSWGTWDTIAREELFSFIETENIPGVLLVSGDRHGTRGFTIPRPSGFAFYEFELASLGGVPGPDAVAKDTTNQLYGYHGTDVIAFGEFTFNTKGSDPQVIFKLIDQFGNILEEYILQYRMLTPGD